MSRLLLLIPTAVYVHVVCSWIVAIVWARQLNPGIDVRHLAPMFSQSIQVVDWDVVLSITLGIAALGYAVIDHRRTTKLDDFAQELGERLAAIESVVHDSRDMVDRLARLEATSTDAMTVEQRIASLEVKAERDEHLEERIASIGERVAAVETSHTLIDRLARVETQIESQHLAERIAKLEAASTDTETEDETE